MRVSVGKNPIFRYTVILKDVYGYIKECSGVHDSVSVSAVVNRL